MPGSQFGRFTVYTHPDIEGREYKMFMIIEHDDNMVGNNQPVNLCLLRNIGPHATRCRGGYVAHAFKYLYSDKTVIGALQIYRSIQVFASAPPPLDRYNLIGCIIPG